MAKVYYGCLTGVAYIYYHILSDNITLMNGDLYKKLDQTKCTLISLNQEKT
jgi:hypothetical protein